MGKEIIDIHDNSSNNNETIIWKKRLLLPVEISQNEQITLLIIMWCIMLEERRWSSSTPYLKWNLSLFLYHSTNIYPIFIVV